MRAGIPGLDQFEMCSLYWVISHTMTDNIYEQETTMFQPSRVKRDQHLHNWLRGCAFVAAALATGAAVAAAQNWPQRPVSVVVPFPAGGSTDTIARMLSAPLNEKLGQPFVVDNRPGATGAIGATFVKRA